MNNRPIGAERTPALNEDKNMTLKEAINLAEDRINRVAKLELRPWNIEGCFIELSKQAGDLAKLIMTYEEYYALSPDQVTPQYKDRLKDEIGDELADLLYVIIRIAKHYDVDLLEAHVKARQKEDTFLTANGV